MRRKSTFIRFVKEGEKERAILEQARREGNILFGGKNVQRQIGIFSRKVSDIDLFSKTPKKSAIKTEKNLDRLHGIDLFYVKPALHPGTFKVMDKGHDEIRGTEDDFGVVDYSKTPTPTPKTTVIRGIKHRVLSQELKARKRALKNKMFAYRAAKDKSDIARIKLAQGRK